MTPFFSEASRTGTPLQAIASMVWSLEEDGCKGEFVQMLIVKILRHLLCTKHLRKSTMYSAYELVPDFFHQQHYGNLMNPTSSKRGKTPNKGMKNGLFIAFHIVGISHVFPGEPRGPKALTCPDHLGSLFYFLRRTRFSEVNQMRYEQKKLVN